MVEIIIVVSTGCSVVLSIGSSKGVKLYHVFLKTSSLLVVVTSVEGTLVVVTVTGGVVADKTTVVVLVVFVDDLRQKNLK